MTARRPRSGPYLFGDRFTLADIALYPWFEQSGVLEQLSEFRLPPDCCGLSEWRHAVGERRAVRQHTRTTDWYAVRYRTYLAA
ncbi:glutathione S-transferase C-terminal domain-containing protein [Bradyrhizobium sp. AZCC 1588]|uniref:glutathione S-transferase C-terminal domain-containing protein n=1 Tax=unclassified Bradyrhizobium TaxID=2631580 RepID=UPI003FA581D8